MQAVVDHVKHLYEAKRHFEAAEVFAAMVDADDTDTRDAVLLACYPHVLPSDDRQVALLREMYAAS